MDNDSKRKRNRGACTNCRQAKVKCDANTKFPHPCTRCGKMDRPVHCRIDPSYKRATVKRTDGGESPRQSTSVATSPEDPIVTLLKPLIAPVPGLLCSDKSVGQVYLPGHTVSSYFKRFFDSFHPHIPLFQQHLDPETTFATSPFLFWTICTVGARPIPGTDPQPYLLLVQEIRILLSQIVMQTSRSVDIVQALLLLCEFPLPSERLREDTGWTCGALAVRIATSIGLHRPHHSEDSSDNKYTSSQIQERTRAWLYCFITDTAFSIGRGIPCMMREDWSIVSASRENSLGLNNTAEVSKLVRISRFMAQVNFSLGCSPATPTGLVDAATRTAFIQTFDREIQELEVTLSPMKIQTQLYFHMAILHLHVFELLSSDSDPVARIKSVLAAVSSATAISEISVQIPALYYPFSACMYIAMSAMCLLKIYPSPNITEYQRSSALTSVAQTLSVIKSVSLVPRDISARAGQLIQVLVTAARFQPGDETDATVRSRMGAGNMLFDAIRKAKTFRGIQQGYDGLPDDPDSFDSHDDLACGEMDVNWEWMNIDFGFEFSDMAEDLMQAPG